MPGELLKYGNEQVYAYLTALCNEMLESYEDIGLGKGTLIVLPKPGKPLGLLSSLRPIVLKTIRETLSLIVLIRIRPAVDQFLPASQSGFRQNRSTAVAVWTHKWMIARVMKVREEIHILGVDQSRAFDTLNRQRMIDGLK